MGEVLIERIADVTDRLSINSQKQRQNFQRIHAIMTSMGYYLLLFGKSVGSNNSLVSN